MRASSCFRAALLAASVSITFAAHAQKPSGLPGNYPSKPVRVVIASGPGGALDISGRLIFAKLTERWGSSFIMENRTGNNVAFDNVSKSAPDGYTLMVSSNSSFFTADQVSKMPFNVRTKFPPIAQFISAPYIVAVTNSLPVSNMKELLAYAKANPDVLNYAFSSTGSASHLAGELIKLLAGVKMQGVAFKGVGPAYLEQMAGRIHITFGTAASSMPLVKAGKIRAVAVTSSKRAKAVPDLPSVTETLPKWENLDSWVGLLGVEGMSPVFINIYNKEVNTVLDLPEVEKVLTADGSETTPGTPEQLRKSIAESLDTAKRIVTEAKINLGSGAGL
jgi:tripartite-type tricarboxylate transporter receptor subunit TctC